MMRRSPMKPGVALKRTAFARTARKEKVTVSKLRRNSKPKATAAEIAHMCRVAALGCCLCHHLGFGATPAEVHHVRLRHGWGRSGHFATIPLCPTHHRGQPFGVHDMGRQQFTTFYGISELDLLAATNAYLGIENTSIAEAL